MTIREILNRIFWNSKQRKEDYIIIIIHRNANVNQKTIPFKRIKKIRTSWFTYKDERGNETIIPFHRIVKIKNIKINKSIWQKKQKNE